MKVTLYIPVEGDSGRFITDRIVIAERGYEVVTTADLARLGKEWAAGSPDKSLFVLCPADFQELLAIQASLPQSLNPPLVFILPDNARETRDAAYRSRPRFVFSRDDNFRDINSVLLGMLQAKKTARV